MEWLIEALIRTRKSTVKRVINLTEEQLDFSSADNISIRDIAWHIGRCDNAAIKPFKPELEFDDRIYPGLAHGRSKENILHYLDQQLESKSLRNEKGRSISSATHTRPGIHY